MTIETKLTNKQEQFCQNIAIHHMTQHDAYINAYDTSNCSDVTIDVNASKLAADAKVSLRISELKSSVLDYTIMSVRKRKQRLSELALVDLDPKEVKPGHVVQAIDLLNKMDDVYKTDTRESQTIINIIVKDNETKDLLNRVEDNTHVIETGYKLLPDHDSNAPESTQDAGNE